MMSSTKLTARDLIIILMILLNTLLIMTGHRELDTKVSDLTIASSAAVHQCEAVLK